MSVASYPILKLKPRTISFIFLCSSFFLMFSYTFKSMQMRSFVYSSLRQRAISQLSFGTMFGSPGYIAADIWVML